MDDNTSFADTLPVAQRAIGGDAIQTINARDLHTTLGVGRRFATWITERIERYGFQEGTDYITLEVFPETGKNPQGGRPAIEYHISLDMAKELAMVENNEQGKRVRRYFITIEREHRRVLSAGNDLPLGQFASAIVSLRAELAQMQNEIGHLRRTVDDPQRQIIGDGGWVTAHDLIKDSAIQHRTRRSLTLRISNELTRRCMERGVAMQKQLGRDSIRLFPRHVAEQFMRDVGDRWANEHNANVNRQGVLPFMKPHRVK